MPDPTQQTVELDGEATVKARLDFAQRSFTNAHDLNRFMDEKANFILAVVAGLTTVIFVVASAAYDTSRPDPLLNTLKLLAGIGVLVYMLLALRVVYSASRVYGTLSRMKRPDTNAPGLLYPKLLLERFGENEERYFKQLSESTVKDLLRDYANQIVEVSRVYATKEKYINTSSSWFRWTIFSWSVVTLLLLGIRAYAHW